MPRKTESKATEEKKKVKETTLEKKEWFEGTGRRKTAVARARLYLNHGDITVNEKSIETYFPSEVAKKAYQEPFKIVNRLDQFGGSIKVIGGGHSAQVEAVVLAIANALVHYDEALRSSLSVAGLLTRDSRMKERRKYGLAGKARARKQSPKR
ncbi:MAG: 30S ribosomal protein S9 [Patescibacteria group bacterium]|nr:30S ribosomal protein S9 [Patescibacteria group bacterium]